MGSSSNSNLLSRLKNNLNIYYYFRKAELLLVLNVQVRVFIIKEAISIIVPLKLTPQNLKDYLID